MSKYGIDVSSYQGTIDWSKVKLTDVKFAILKIIRKDLDPDKQFENNWNGCEAVGMPIHGVYNYSYATTVAKAKSDAQKVLQILNGRKTRVYLDVEDNCLKGLGYGLINIINAYAEVIIGAGLEFGVYTGSSFYNTYIKPYGGLSCPLWIAKYGSNTGTMNVNNQPQIANVNMVGWQFTSRALVSGIYGYVDKDVWYEEIESSVIDSVTTTKTVKIGHASIDENGKIASGLAGDQTGKEVCIRDWYSKGWNVLLRPKNEELAEGSARFVESVCQNENVGYNQNQRNTLHTQAEAVNYDGSAVGPCECDCSSFMHVAAIAGGCSALAYGTNGYTTSTMRKAFVATGEYIALTDSKYLTSDKHLKRGDILVREGSHTVMILTDGENADEVLEKETNPYPEPERLLYRKVIMQRGDDVKWLQYELIRHGCLPAYNAKGKSNIDGKLGDDTSDAIGVFQKKVGIKLDKKCGVVTRTYLKM